MMKKLIILIAVSALPCFAQSKASGSAGAGSASASGFPTEVFASSKTYDPYHGRTDKSCPGWTHPYWGIQKIGNRWWFCTPVTTASTGIPANTTSHTFIAMTVASLLPNNSGLGNDCTGTNTNFIATQKYGDVGFNNAWQQLKRLTTWGFFATGEDTNEVYYQGDATCTSCVWPNHAQPVPLPLINEDKPSQNAISNVNGYLTEPVKDLLQGVNSHYTYFLGGMTPDMFDTKIHTWWTTALQNSNHVSIRANDPWILTEFTDDSDWLWCMGAGPDFATTGGGSHTNTNCGWITLVTSPVQTFVKSVQQSGKTFTYTDTLVHSKADATNPAHGTCSISAPCSLRDYLFDKYSGSISALNTAWGSTYTTFDSSGTQVTGEAFATGDGTTKTFTHTFAHASVSPNSVSILVAGSIVAGDCPWAKHGGGGCTVHTTNQGDIGSPTLNFITESTSTINYTTGAVTLNFVTAPASGATITVNYIFGGWMAGGTGLMDEDGSHSWVPSNGLCMAVPDVNYPAYTACAGTSTTAVGTDLEGWTAQYAARFFKTMHDDFKAVSAIPYCGADFVGSYGAAPDKNILAGEAPYVDCIFTGAVKANAPFPAPAQMIANYSYITRYAGDVPLMFGNLSANANADSAYYCDATQTFDVGTQVLRGRSYYDLVNYTLNNQGFNGDFPVIGYIIWAWQDFASLNQGVVSLHDNPYDGLGATRATQVDPISGATSIPEQGDYTNQLSWQVKANYLWLLIP